MSSRQSKKPPSWFIARDYEDTTKLDVLGWANMLWIRQYWRTVPLKLDIPDDESLYQHQSANSSLPTTKLPVASSTSLSKQNTPHRERRWENYLQDTRLTNAALPFGESFPAGIGTPRSHSFDDITDWIKAPEYAQRIIDWDIGAMGHRILLVDPQASDQMLLAGFQSWLEKIREQRPLGIRRRGRKTTNQKISESDFNSWCHYRVLAVLDLDFHAKLFGESKLSHEVLADILKIGGEVDPKEWGRTARKKASYALTVADVLLSQAQSGMK
jgi:Family of unknown function (DUF6387)